MQVLTKYQAVEAPLFLQAESSADISIKSRKIELAIAALSSFTNPYIKKDILNTPSFVESVMLIKRLSPSGKLSLARTLLDQIS